MKKIIAIVKWMWCRNCGDRQNFEERGEAWVCTRCGGEG